MLSIALRYVLDQRTVVRHEVTGDVYGLRVPDFTVLEVVFLRVQRGQES